MSLQRKHARILLSGVLLAAAAGITAIMRPWHPPALLWYLDLNTNELFAAPGNQAPPIAAPSGADPSGKPAGVLAAVVMPAAHDGRRIAYIQCATAEVRALCARRESGEALTPAEVAACGGGVLVAVPPTAPGQAIRWHAIDSREGIAITGNMRNVGGPPGWRLDLPGD